MRDFLRRYGPAILSGMLLAFAFPAVHAWPLAWVGLVPLLAQALSLSPRAAAGRFLLAGYIYNAIVLQWLLTHFYWAGGMGFFAHALLSLYLALFWGGTGALWTWLRHRLPTVPPALTLAVLWSAMEFLQGTLFTGFGWTALGYSQAADLWFLQNAAFGGVTLLSAVLALCNGLLAEAWARGRRALRLGLAAAVVVLAHASGAAVLAEPRPADPPLRVGVLQPNFAQEIKWDPEFALPMLRLAVEKCRAMASRTDIDLFVWPETLITVELSYPEALELLQALTRDTGAALYSGATRSDESGAGEFNASVYVGPDGSVVDYYDKIHLAPFGEYVPFARYLPFLRQAVPVGDILAGEEPKLFEAKGHRFGPLICFEVLFGEMAYDLRRQGADFLVVITNLGWFGRSNALPEEIEIAKVRAVETRLPLVHSANTGISGMIDPWGRLSPVSVYLGPDQASEVRPEFLPDVLTMERAFGVFDLPAPAPHPLPWGPRLFPRAMLALTALAIAAALLLGRRRPGAEAPPPAQPAK